MFTIRELIIQDFMDRGEAVVSTGSPPDYSTDIGDNVLRARPKVDPDELPCMVIWPQQEEAENKHGAVLHRMIINVEGVAYFASLSPSEMSEKILGDLIKCFTSYLWVRTPNYIESIVYQRGGVDSYPEEGSVSVGAYAEFLVSYWTAAGDPYSQT
jgi:hypothetical protein